MEFENNTVYQPWRRPMHAKACELDSDNDTINLAQALKDCS